MAWNLDLGGFTIRKDLHDAFGGGREGGISPSRQTSNVFIFTDPPIGRLHGYIDGWGADGCFHYSGEGQKGDQRMVRGNRAILEHRVKGRALRLFRGSGGQVEYLGEFAIDQEEPFYESEAPESGRSDVIRKVIVFRLRPIGRVIEHAEDVLPPLVDGDVAIVDVENMNTESFATTPSGAPREADRREQRLVLAYKAYMQQKGSTIKPTRCRPAGEAKPLFSDVWNQTRENLIEAKGSVTRESIRMVIGQLADYSRFIHAQRRAALLPERPRKDLEGLLGAQNISVIWQEDNGFLDNADGAFS